MLLSAGTNVNTKTFLRETALHFAVQKYHVEVIEILLVAKADVNTQTTNRETALFIPDTAMLLNAGENVAIKDNFNQTSMHKRVTDIIFELPCKADFL